MEPNKGRVLISLALLVSGIVGAAVALSQSPRGMELFEAPLVQTQPMNQPVATIKPIQQAPRQETPQQSRSQEVEKQLEQSNAAKLLDQLSNKADSAVQDSKNAVEGFIQRKATEQRDRLKQAAVDALREAITGKVTQQSTSLSDEFKGIQLTAEQNAEIQNARKTLQSELVKQFKENPNLVEQLQSELQKGRLDTTLSQPVTNYSNDVTQILTPQQQQQWQKNFNLGKLLNR
ncbi:MAG TPA: hypothetical protein VL134_12145 [Leptolyngbya sp.]|jgi:hypothetical protein|nr:hypothetical protein [Leptolyngbya sp.]